jgi:hypothetical protein
MFIAVLIIFVTVLAAIKFSEILKKRDTHGK